MTENKVLHRRRTSRHTLTATKNKYNIPPEKINLVERGVWENRDILLSLVKEQREKRKISSKEIAYEEATVKVPILVMELLRKIDGAIGMTPNEYLERAIISMVRADVDAFETFYPLTPKELHEELNALFDLFLNNQPRHN